MKPGECCRSWTVVVMAFAALVRGSRSFIFDQCGGGPDAASSREAAGNLTAQECVGKLILDALTKASEDPESFFKANESDDDGGTMRLVKLKFDNGTMAVDRHYEIDESRSSSAGSFWEQLVDAFKKLANYSGDHGILVSLPQWSRTFPPVTVIDENDVFEVVNEMVYQITGRGKHPQKKYALLFPLLATFKFLVIKALLVPILAAVMMIKKILVVGVMALPAVLTMLRFCRNNNGFGNLMATGAVGPIGQAAAFAPLTADMSGDYSSYVQQAAAASQQNGYKEYSKNLMDAMKATYKKR